MKKFIAVFILMFLIIPCRNFSFSQDVLYKKDSSSLIVKILDFNGRTVTYKNPEDSTGIIFYLSKTVLDSLTYNGGRTLRFQEPAGNIVLSQKVLNRNYLRLSLADMLAGMLGLDYERLSETGITGFQAGICINLISEVDQAWYENHSIFESATYRPFYFFVRTGIDYFPFNYSLEKTSVARTSTGLHVIAGSVRKFNYDAYQYNGPEIIHGFLAILSWSVDERFYLGNNFQASAGMEISLLPFLSFFNPRLSISISF